MTIAREQKYREMASRGKYRKLYAHLSCLGVQEWSTSFNEIEAIVGFQLPASARLHRPWWGNQRNGNGHSQSLAWTLAGLGNGTCRHGRRDAAAETEAPGGCSQAQPR